MKDASYMTCSFSIRDARLSHEGSDLYETHKPKPTPQPGGGTWTTLGPNSVPWIVHVSHLVAPGVTGYHVLTKTARPAGFARQPRTNAVVAVLVGDGPGDESCVAE